jgi:hypothetical protein
LTQNLPSERGILKGYMKHILGFCAAFCFFFLPFFSYAQSSAQLLLSPAFPNASEPFTAKLEGMTSNITSVVWFINGKEQTGEKNKRSISTTADTTMTIGAKITDSAGKTTTLTKTITPIRIDIIVEANTLVPPFYKGRSLGSSGSSLKATALVFGKNIDSRSLRYSWKTDGIIENELLGAGNNTFFFTPQLQKEVSLTVSVLSSQNTILGKKTISIPVAEPEVYFYERNPLRGLSTRALTNPFVFIGEEMSIRAEAYYVEPESLSDSFSKQWKINNVPVETSGADKNELTIEKQGNSGKATLLFKIRHLEDLIQGTSKSIDVQF